MRHLFCVYSDEHGTDHDALTLRQYPDGTRDLVIVRDHQPVDVQNVPPRSARITLEARPEVRNRRGRVVQEAMTLPVRRAGDYWRE